MKRNNTTLFSCLILFISLILIVGCNKKDDAVDTDIRGQSEIMNVDNNSKSHNNDKEINFDKIDKSIAISVEINKLKDKQLKDIIEDKKETLKNGVYCYRSEDEGYYYILINGIEYWYSNISFNIKDILSISYNTEYEKGLRIQHLFVINPNNVEDFDEVELINNGNKENFRTLFQ